LLFGRYVPSGHEFLDGVSPGSLSACETANLPACETANLPACETATSAVRSPASPFIDADHHHGRHEFDDCRHVVADAQPLLVASQPAQLKRPVTWGPA